MVLVGECRGWDEETDLVEHWQAYRHLFPAIPERSRFNRRRRALAPAINDLRRRFLCGGPLLVWPASCVVMARRSPWDWASSDSSAPSSWP